ncbi:MAG TPA: hypothetical protein VJ260_02895 [Vicinamibacterales bacterium]|nr:hypothetical protein [Vicinamibacterales bacterium]
MQSQNLFGINACLAKAGLTGLSGAATTFTTANALVYAIGGKAYAKAAVAGGASPVVDGVTGLPITLVANKGTVIVWALDAAGTVFAVQGSTEALLPSGNFMLAAPQFPSMPDTLTPFAYSITKAGATAVGTWTFGVSNWNATGMSHVAQDVIVLPVRPQTA